MKPIISLITNARFKPFTHSAQKISLETIKGNLIRSRRTSRSLHVRMEVEDITNHNQEEERAMCSKLQKASRSEEEMWHLKSISMWFQSSDKGYLILPSTS